MDVTVQIFNILGQLVSQPVHEQQQAGRYTFIWDASSYASGVYLYRMTGSAKSGKKYVQQKKMLLVK